MSSNFLGSIWGSTYTLHADEGDIKLVGYDHGVRLLTPESQTEGWALVHAQDDPQGDPDVLEIAGHRFRKIPD